MSHVGLGRLLKEFGIKKTSDYYQLPPGWQSMFVSRLYSELVDHAREGLSAIREASGVKLHFLVESDPEQGLSNLPDDVFLRKICFYANRTLVTFPFHETRRFPWKALRRGRETTFERDKDVITFGKYRSFRNGYGGKIEEVRKSHHLLRPEFEAFLHLLCTTRPFLESGDLTILPSYLPEASKRSLRIKAGLGLIPANFQLPELRSQFEENGLEGFPAGRRPGKVPYLYLPYFNGLNSEEVLKIRDEDRDSYEDFQNHLWRLLDGLPQIESEKALLQHMKEIDEAVQRLVTQQESRRRGSVERHLPYGAGAVTGFLPIALTPSAGMSLPLSPALDDGLKYIQLGQPGSYKHDELHLMSRLATFVPCRMSPDYNIQEQTSMPLELGLSALLPGREILSEALVVPVLYATDRALEESPRAERFFGTAPSVDEKRHPKLNFGYLQVSLPLGRKRGRLPRPTWWKLWQRKGDLTRSAILLNVTPLGGEAFLTPLLSEIEKAPKPEALVFIHGYNVTFAQAAEQAAQLAVDLDFEGVPIIYSWPSKGTLLGFCADAEMAAWSGKNLSNFLDWILAKGRASMVHVIAHSMGNRVLLGALEYLPAVGTERLEAKDNDHGKMLQQVVFAAPEVNWFYFSGSEEKFRGKADRFTVYGSAHDWALKVAEALQGRSRAGQLGSDMVAIDGVDLVDVSAADTCLHGFGHSYFASNPRILNDIALLVHRNCSPEERGLEPQPKLEQPKYWAVPATGGSELSPWDPARPRTSPHA